MSDLLPRYYRGEVPETSDFGDLFELVMLAGHSVTNEPLYVMKNLDGGLPVAVPFTEIGKSYKVDYKHKPGENDDT